MPKRAISVELTSQYEHSILKRTYNTITPMSSRLVCPSIYDHGNPSTACPFCPYPLSMYIRFILRSGLQFSFCYIVFILCTETSHLGGGGRVFLGLDIRGLCLLNWEKYRHLLEIGKSNNYMHIFFLQNQLK